jgi:hypothetical protein
MAHRKIGMGGAAQGGVVLEPHPASARGDAQSAALLKSCPHGLAALWQLPPQSRSGTAQPPARHSSVNGIVNYIAADSMFKFS